MDLSVLLVSAGALILAAGLPGPGIAALMAQVLARGARSVLPFLVAMWVGEAMWLSFAVFGLALIAEALHGLFVVMKYAGVVYLGYLAWKMWTAPIETHSLPETSSDRPWRMFAAGLTVAAVDEVLSTDASTVRRAFVMARPPGHHVRVAV